MKVSLSIEARSTSTRLPGKVLMPMRGMPMLELQIRRVREARLVSEIVVATTANATDDPIAALCQRLGVACFRGSEHDVLERVVRAHQMVGSGLIVELTGDNPLQDPALVDQCVAFFRKSGFDYVSNCIPSREYPEGMNVQVFPLAVLEETARVAHAPEHREHVSLYIYRSGKFRVGYVGPETAELRRPELSFTVDTRAEYEFVKAAAEHFPDQHFTLHQLLRAVDTVPALKSLRPGSKLSP